MEPAYTALLKNEFLAIVTGMAADMGVTAYFVGGGLRDILMGREMKDMDFVLSGAPKDLPAIFARKIEGTFFWLDEQRLQSRVVMKSNGKVMTFDFAPQRGCDIIQDLLLRDFTINALALPLLGRETSIIDPFNGMRDLRQGLITACSEVSFDHDPLRLLRALRFATILGFSIESATWQKICEKAPLLQKVASERIRDELFQILEAWDAGAALGKLHESGLLAEIIPCRSVPGESGSTSMNQRINSVLEVESVMAELDLYFPDAGEYVHDYLCRAVESGVTMGSLVKLAVFLERCDSRHRKAAETAEKLRLGCNARRVLEVLCERSEPILALSGCKPTERAMYRFFRDREPAGLGVLIITLARKFLPGELCSEMAGYYFNEYPNVHDDTLLSGEEIMDILGIGPGRLVGEAMRRLRYAESIGLVNDKAEARSYLGKNLLTKDEAVI